MTDVLVYGDTMTVPEMRHEIPIAIPDPFLYVERDGRRVAVISGLERSRVEELDGIAVRVPEDLGYDDLLAQGVVPELARLEVYARACQELQLREAVVPRTFPLLVAERLRADGIELHVDRDHFDDRRRRKSPAELAGIRRAQAAAEAGMAAARELLRAAEPVGGALQVDGEPLTSERLKAAIVQAFSENDAVAEVVIASHGPQTAMGHEMGSGVVAPDEPVVFDLAPRDRETACFSDMTRTFVVGEPSAELRTWQELCREALERVVAAIRPGVPGAQLYALTCEVFEEHGYPTQRTKRPGEVLESGFFHSLGHGVGLEVHEPPMLGRTQVHTLVAGDVVAVEPGLYLPGVGGCRLEDVVLVTEDGAEVLTDFPYDLAP
jgi:Xaa-Pro aminopeptidase